MSFRSSSSLCYGTPYIDKCHKCYESLGFFFQQHVSREICVLIHPHSIELRIEITRFIADECREIESLVYAYCHWCIHNTWRCRLTRTVYTQCHHQVYIYLLFNKAAWLGKHAASGCWSEESVGISSSSQTASSWVMLRALHVLVVLAKNIWFVSVDLAGDWRWRANWFYR